MGEEPDRTEGREHRRPWWERFLAWATGPIRAMWSSHLPLDAYALVHMGGAMGDALIAVALADSVFFSLPVGQAKLKVALYLVLTMAPLAVAAPVLVPLLANGLPAARRRYQCGLADGDREKKCPWT